MTISTNASQLSLLVPPLKALPLLFGEPSGAHAHL